MEECKFVVEEQMKNGKSCGDDGLNRLFYLTFWNAIKEPLLASLLEGTQKGELARSQTRSVVRLIPKREGNIRDITQVRPISLMNTDPKILSKVLTNRVEPILRTVVSQEQNGYFKGRYIGNGIKLLQYIKEYAQLHKLPCAIINLDMIKAFDSCSHQFLYKILRKLGFGPIFTKQLQALYKNASSAVINGGTTTKRYFLHRSNRQGDPISGILFELVFQAFINKIKQSNIITGFEFIDQSHRITCYADDASIIISNIRQYYEVMKISKKFGEVSGLRANPAKTEIFQVHGQIFPDNFDECKIVEEFRVLGVYLHRNSEVENNINFDKITRKIQQACFSMSERNLSEFGRVLVLKVFILSLAQYAISMTLPNEDHVKKINKLQYDFCWNRCDRIKRTVFNKSADLGGCEIDPFKLKALSAQAAWIYRSIINPDAPWVSFFLHDLNKIGGYSALNGKISPNVVDRFTFQISKNIVKSWITFNNNIQGDQKFVKEMTFSNNPLFEKKNSIINAKSLIKAKLNCCGDFYYKDGTVVSFNDAIDIGLSRSALIEYNQAFSSIPTEMKNNLKKNGGNVPNSFKFLYNRNKYKLEKFKQEGWPGIREAVFFDSEQKAIPATSMRQAQFLYSNRNTELTNENRSAHFHNMNKRFQISEKEWTNLYQRTKRLTKNTYYRSWLFRISHGLIYGNSDRALQKPNLNIDPTCFKCGHNKMNKIHLWIECPKSIKIWNEIQNHYQELFTEKLTDKQKILGVMHDPKNDIVTFSKNIVILITIKQIFESIYRDYNVSIHNILQNIYLMERYEAKIPQGENELPHDIKWKLLVTYPLDPDPLVHPIQV